MSSIMEDIYNGKVYPEEQILPRNDEYRNASKKTNKLFTELSEKLDEEGREKLEEYQDSMLQLDSIMCMETYKVGLSTGLMLMKEAEETVTGKKKD